MGGIVAMVPKALSLSQEATYRLGRDLDEWSKDRSRPLVDGGPDYIWQANP